jgi:hypothetical protein
MRPEQLEGCVLITNKPILLGAAMIGTISETGSDVTVTINHQGRPVAGSPARASFAWERARNKVQAV